MRKRNLKEKVETVAAVRLRQRMWVDWMREATEGLTDDDLVLTLSEITPFGTYLLHMEPAEIGGYAA